MRAITGTHPDIEPALQVLRTLRDGLHGIRSEAVQLERSGAIPAIGDTATLRATGFTGAPLDVAVHGNGFFVLEGPKGPLYTRNGVFHVSGEGELQNSGGLPVSGPSAKISLPPGAGEITIRDDGTVLADGNDAAFPAD